MAKEADVSEREALSKLQVLHLLITLYIVEKAVLGTQAR